MPLVHLCGRCSVHLGSLEELDHALDVVPGRRVADDAHPQHVAAGDAGRRDEAEAALLERSDERRVAPVLVVLVAVEAPAETEDGQRRRHRELELRRLLDPPPRRLGEVEAPVDRAANASTPNAHSESQTLIARDVRVSWIPRSARLTSSDSGDRVVQVGGRHLERAPQEPGLADEQAAALVRLVQPLVRVERDGVRFGDPVECASPPLGEHGEASVRGVHVEPEPVLAAHLAELPERVDRAGVRRAAVRRDEEGNAAGALVRLDRPAERRRGHAARQGRPAARGSDPAGSRGCGRRARATSATGPRRTRRGARSSLRPPTRAPPRARSCSPPTRRSAASRRPSPAGRASRGTSRAPGARAASARRPPSRSPRRRCTRSR